MEMKDRNRRPGESIEHQFEEREVIFHDDIVAYVDGIIRDLTAAAPEQKPLLVLEALRQEKIKRDFHSQTKLVYIPEEGLAQHEEERAKVKTAQLEEKGDEREEYNQAVNDSTDRLRRAIAHELAGRPELGPNDFFLIKELLSAPKKEAKAGAVIYGGEAGGGQEVVLRVMSSSLEFTRQSFVQALERLQSLPPHPHVLRLKFYDPVQRQLIVERRQFQSLLQPLYDQEEKKEKSSAMTRQALGIIRDCMVGAAYLEDHGVVLQDINLGNLGIDRETGKGILFDLDGLAVDGSKLQYRMLPTRKDDDSYVPPELKEKNDGKIHSGEMTYQFGNCLRKVISHTAFSCPPELEAKLKKLTRRMMLRQPAERGTLAAAIQELNDLIPSLPAY